MKFRQLFSFKQKEVDSAFKQAKKKDSIPGFTLLIVPSKKVSSSTKEEGPPLSHGKILIVIPRKAGKAHERNLIKRRIKAIYYEEKLYLKPVISIVLVREEATKISFEELKKFLVKNLR